MSQEFGAVLVTGLAVFGLVFVATQVDTGIFNTAEPVDSMNFYKESFGKVGNAQPDAREIRFGDFSVGEARGDILVHRRERATVSSRLLSKETVEINYNATQPRDGFVTFEVLGKAGKGPMFVKVNDRKIFEEHMISGGTPEIRIPEGVLRRGRNTIIIGSNSGIFSSSTYTIEDLKVRVNDRKFHDYVDTFQMYSYELQDFVDAELSFRIDDAIKTRPLEIFVNDQKVYELDRVRGRESVKLNPSNAGLHPGLNVVKFETDGEAVYNVTEARIGVRYLGRTEEALIRAEWPMNRQQLEYAEGNNTQETLKFDYQTLLGSPSPLIIDINGYRHRKMPSNGKNTVKIREGILKEENVMILRNNGTYQLNNVRIGSNMVEE